MRYVSGNIRFVLSYPLASFGHVKNFERTPPNKYVQDERYSCVGLRFVRFSCGLSGSHVVCLVLMSNGHQWIHTVYLKDAERMRTGQTAREPDKPHTNT